MTPPITFVGRFAQMRWLARFWVRALVFGSATLLFGVLAIVPERHMASTSLTPTDPESLGLSGALGQLGAFNNVFGAQSVFGNQAAVEIAMRVGKSVFVRDTVISELRLNERMKLGSRLALHRKLKSAVEIRSLRGGIITISMSNYDGDLARDIVGAYARGMQFRLGQIDKKRIAYKREILLDLVSDASTRLAKAQLTYDSYRLRNKFVDPRSSISAVGGQIPALEGAIKAKEVQLAAARKLYTDDNVATRQVLAELVALQGQLAQAKATTTGQDDSVGKLVDVSSQLFKLERDLTMAKVLYDSYTRYLQGTTVEDLTSSASIRVLEAPYIETARQFYLPALAAAAAFFLLWMAIEFYRLRPPIGEFSSRREEHD